MKPKLKKCDGCDQDKVIWKNHKGNKYCKSCWARHEDNKPVSKAQAFDVPKPRIKTKSKKKSQEDAVYSQLRKVFLRKHPTCEAKLDGCSVQSTDVHHKKGRGEFYLDVSTWLPACRSCHDWIELHPKEAKDMGFSESRLEK